MSEPLVPGEVTWSLQRCAVLTQETETPGKDGLGVRSGGLGVCFLPCTGHSVRRGIPVHQPRPRPREGQGSQAIVCQLSPPTPLATAVTPVEPTGPLSEGEKLAACPKVLLLPGLWAAGACSSSLPFWRGCLLWLQLVAQG